MIPEGLGQNASCEGTKACCKCGVDGFYSSNGPSLLEGVPLAEKAGLRFPVALNPQPLTLTP